MSVIAMTFFGESGSGGLGENVHATSAEVASGRSEVQIWTLDGAGAFEDLDVGTNNNGDSGGTVTTHGWELEICNAIENSDFGSYTTAYILKMGVGGTTLAHWETGQAAWTALTAEYTAFEAALPSIDLNVAVISLGINDAASAGTSASDYYDGLDDLIDRTFAFGSFDMVILCHHMPKFYSPYNAEMDRLCRDKTDVYRVTGENLGTVLGEAHLHLNYFGIKEQARRIMEVILTTPTAPSAPAAASAITWTDNTNTTTSGNDLVLTSGTTGGARRATPLRMTSNWVVEWKADTAIKSDEVVVCLHGKDDNDYDYDSGNNYICAVFQDGGNLYSSTIGGSSTNETAAPSYPFWMRFIRAPFGDNVLAQHSTNQTTWTTFKTFSGVLADRYSDIYVKAFMKGSQATAEVTDATVQDPDYVAYPTGTLTASHTPRDADGCIACLFAEEQLATDRYAADDVIYLTDGHALMPDWSNNGSTDRPTLKASITPTGKAVFRYDGSDDKFSGPSLTALTEGTAILVVKTDADPPPGGVTGGLWQLGTDEISWFTWPGDSGIYDHFLTNARKTTGNPTLNLASAFRVYVVRSKSGDWTSRIDGSVHYTTSSNTVAGPASSFLGGGGGQWLDGDIALFALYDRWMPDAEIERWEDWAMGYFNTGLPIEEDYAGSVTPVGVLTKQVMKALAGSSTASGALTRVKTAPRSFTGSVTASGSLVKTANKTLAGSSTQSGVLTQVKSILRSFTGSVTASGSLVKSASKALTGSSTASGSLTKQASKTLAGSSTPTGLLQKLLPVSFAGSSTASGTLTNQANKGLTGSVTPQGALTRLVTKLLSGSVTASGSLNTSGGSTISLSGSCTPSATLVSLVTKALTGSCTASGLLYKTANKTLAGSTTASGELTTSGGATISLSGSTTPSGSLVKGVTKFLEGSVTPSGVLSRVVSKFLSLSGSVTPSGTLETLKTVLLSVAGSVTPSGAISHSVRKFLTGSVTAVGSIAKGVAKAFTGSVSAVGVFTKYILNAVRYPIVRRTVKSHDARFVVGSHDVRPTPRRY